MHLAVQMIGAEWGGSRRGEWSCLVIKHLHHATLSLPTYEPSTRCRNAPEPARTLESDKALEFSTHTLPASLHPWTSVSSLTSKCTEQGSKSSGPGQLCCPTWWAFWALLLPWNWRSSPLPYTAESQGALEASENALSGGSTSARLWSQVEGNPNHVNGNTCVVTGRG